MNDMVMDWTMGNYLLTLFVCAYGAGLFAWWGLKAGRPSAVFLYVMGIFIAEGWAMGIAIQARWLHFYSGGTGYADYVLHSPLWAFRQLPTTMILLALAIHMSFRAFVKRRNQSARDFASTRDRTVAEQASDMVHDAAEVAALVVKTSGKVAAQKVSDEAKKAADGVQTITEKTVIGIRNIEGKD